MDTELMVIAKDTENFINEIVTTKGGNLPDVIGDVLKIFEFTDFKAKAWKIMSDKMTKLSDQQEVHDLALASGQRWGAARIYAKKRIGEITMEMPKSRALFEKNSDGTIRNTGATDVPGKQEKLKEQGLTTQSVSDAERMAKNPEIVEEVIERAIEKGEIPTQTAVLNRISVKKQHERAEESRIRNTDKRVKTTPKIVKDYLEGLKDFTHLLEFSLSAAERGQFSPESIGVIGKRQERICVLFDSLMEAISE